MKFEANGMLFEFDEKLLLKQEVKVGDSVQLLLSEYGGALKCYPGVITQIVPFKDKPAVEVMYLETGYSSADIRRVFIVQGEEKENSPKIVKMDDHFLPFTKDRCIDILQKEIIRKENELQEARMKLDYFNKYFGYYFEDIKKEKEEEHS